MSAYRSLLLPAVLVAVCLGAYFLVFLPPTLVDADPLSRFTSLDLHNFFLPKFAYGSHEVAHGALPLWNRYEFGGIPFLATAQPAVLYPPKAILFAIFGENTAYWIFIVFHYVLLAGGFLLLMREIGIAGLPAFAGTAAWTFAAQLLTSNYHPVRVANLAFVAPCFMLVERIGRGVSARRSSAWLVVILALQLVAGYPEATADLGFLVAVHATVRFFTKEWSMNPAKSVPLFAALFGLAGLVAGLQLVPMVEAARIAQRADLAETMQLIMNLSSGGTKGALLLIAPGLCIFGLVGIFDRRALAPFAGLLACMLIVGGFAWVRKIPGLSMVRFPFVWFLYSGFYGGWLVAIGVDSFIEANDERLHSKAVRLVVRALAFAWAGFCLYAALRSGPPPASVLVQRLLCNAGAALWSGVAAVGSFALGAVSFPRLKRIGGNWAATLAVVLLVLSHEAAFPYGASRASVGTLPPKGELARFRADGVRITGRTFSVEDAENGYTLRDRIPSLLGAEDSFLPWRYRQVLQSFWRSKWDATFDWSKIARSDGFLRAANVEYVLAGPYEAPLLDANYALVRVGRGQRMLFKHRGALSEAWITYAPRVAPSESWALKYVLAPGFDPFATAAVEGFLEQQYHPAAQAGASLPEQVNRISDTRTDFIVNCPAPGLLVVSESFYPGWRAFVDDRPTKILVTNYVFRGVEVPAGRHRVRIEYRPTSVLLGSALSVVGLLLLTLLFWKSRSEPSSP